MRIFVVRAENFSEALFFKDGEILRNYIKTFVEN